MKILLPVLFTCANALLLPKFKRLDDSATDIAASNNGIENNSSDTISPGNSGNVAGVEVVTTASDEDNLTSSGYIVVLKKAKDEAEYEEHEQWVLNQLSDLNRRKREEDSSAAHEVEFFNVSSFHGYAGDIPETLLDTIRENPLVDFVEQDSLATYSAYTTQNRAPWNLARISQRYRDSSSTEYKYDTESGKGVTVFVIDSGVKVTDPEFEGRARWGRSIYDPSVDTDVVGHGTHVAGIIGSRTYGVAKQVNLVAVKVGGAAGSSISDVIRGVQYAVNEHRKLIRRNTSGFKGSIINLSIGVPGSKAFDLAVDAAVFAGVHVVASAGNYNRDACEFSPGRSPSVITVGATHEDDARLESSNYGPCVDIHAPGANIISLGLSVSFFDALAVESGTSQAAPHVSGLLAYLISLQPDQGSGYFGKRVLPPAIMRQVLYAYSVTGVVTGLDANTINEFAYNGAQSEFAQALEIVGPEAANYSDVPVQVGAWS